MVNIENLIRLATLVRDETANKQNTALRVGGTFLEVVYAIRYLLETVGELDTLAKGLDTRTRFFHGSSADVDALKNSTDLGVYVATGPGWRGLLSVQFDFYSTVSQVALSSSTPDYSEGSLAWKPAPCVMFRTYTNGAWSQWQPVSGGGASGFIITRQNGFYVVDSAKRIGLQYTDAGLDAAKISEHFKSLLGSGGGSVDEDEVREIVEVLLAGAGIQLVPNIVTWAKADDDVHLLEHWSDVTFGVLTDIHGAGTELKAFIDFCNHYNTPYMIHLGDTVAEKYSDGNAFWTNVTGSNKVLNTPGNHDTRYGSTGSNWWYYANKQQSYDTFIKPFMQQNIKGVVQPSDAASTYKCYYYVDLYKGSTSTNIRIIVLDSMSWYDNAAGAAQYSWLDSVLTASRTANKHVVICTHIPINDADVVANCPFDNSSINPNSSPIDTTLAGESSYLDRYITPSSSNVPSAMTLSNLVESHITQGLIFVAYMCGHTHANYLGTIKNHPNQLQIVIPTGKDWSSPAFEDNVIYKYCFSLCGINTESKRLMLFRFGKTTQRWGFDTRSFSYNYDTHKIVQVNGKLTFN